jgi:signal transduction histidine kinase
VGLVLLTGGLLAATLLQVGRSLELARLRERFVADVSHELRTPLQQILIFVQLLRLGRLRSEEERAESLGIVERETHRLIRLVERLLAFSRPATGSLAASDPRADLGPVLREAVQAFRPVAAAAGANLELVGGDEALEVAVAPESLRQVLVNLLDNAVKYGPPGQRITLGAERAGDVARVTVDDQGPGIPPAERERAWRPFFRLEREAANATTGSGIGLAIVREIVEETGGRALLDDAPGGGTRVILELPLAPGSPAREPQGS